MAALNFNANDVEPNAPYEVIPAGDYKAQILSSVMESTKSGNGQYLKLELEIVEGPQAGRKLFDRLNLDNPNAKAVEIAQRTLSAICHAVGRLTVQDSAELHMIPMGIKVNVKPRADRPDEVSNEIGGYKPVGGATAAPRPQTTRPATTTPAATPRAATGSTPPWKKNAAA